MKIGFMGTPAFACRSLEELSKSHRVCVCITMPDRPAGRGRKCRPSPVASFAEGMGIPVIKVADRRAFLDAVRGVDVDVWVIVAFGLILPQEFFSLCDGRCYNLHFSLLPAYRGAAPVNWAIINGETYTGVTVMRVTPRLDAGPIIAQRRVEIAPDETAGELLVRLGEEGAGLLAESMDALERGDARETPQDESAASYAPMLKKEDGLVDWTKPAVQLACFVRGVTPWPSAFTWLESAAGERTRLTLTRVEVVPGAACGEPGTIDTDGKTYFHVACGEGMLAVERLKPAGRKEMSAASFLRGHGVRGARMLLPSECDSLRQCP